MVLFLSEFISKFLTVKWDALGWVDAYCTGACFQLLHPINASSSPPPFSSSHLPGQHAAGPLLEAEHAPRSRGKSFSFFWNRIQAQIFYFLLAMSKFHFEAIINLIEIKMYFQGHIPFKDNSISLSWAETMSKLFLIYFFFYTCWILCGDICINIMYIHSICYFSHHPPPQQHHHIATMRRTPVQGHHGEHPRCEHQGQKGIFWDFQYFQMVQQWEWLPPLTSSSTS